MSRNFDTLSEQEILALAIGAEEDDSRIYGEFARRLQDAYPDTAKTLLMMRDEELRHAHLLMESYKAAYGANILFIRRQDVKGFITRKPLWLARLLSVEQVRKEVELLDSMSHWMPLENSRPRRRQRGACSYFSISSRDLPV